MKFNEKLIELRRKEGLSQEELGYKLNVTRQTVSKWELGQTTPEMDKLVEMSKIFNISVDELINESNVTTNENPIIEDQPIGNESPKKNKIVIIIVVALIIVVVLIIARMFTAFSMFNKTASGIIDGAAETNQNIFDKFFNMFNEVLDAQEDIIGNAEDMIGNSVDEINTSRFNGTLELYNGSNSGMQLKKLLEEVITSNKKEDRKIIVKYMEIETQDTEEIQNLKVNIKESNNFEATFDYDEVGYINKVIIEKVVSEFEVKAFNSSLELYAGSGNGMIVTTVLDQIITSNKTKDQKITVKYKAAETQNEDEIKSIKKNFGTFDNCEITYGYDANGFINKAIIEKM